MTITPPLIFIVDDSPVIRKLVSITLQRAQFQVQGFGDGVELLRYLHADEVVLPDLILLDIGLPKMNGYRVAHLLRTHPRAHTCPIVIVSRRNGLLDHLKMRVLGAHYLDKPFTTHSLLTIVRATLPFDSIANHPPPRRNASALLACCHLAFLMT